VEVPDRVSSETDVILAQKWSGKQQTTTNWSMYSSTDYCCHMMATSHVTKIFICFWWILMTRRWTVIPTNSSAHIILII